MRIAATISPARNHPLADPGKPSTPASATEPTLPRFAAEPYGLCIGRADAG
jgi:hypothetical protein